MNSKPSGRRAFFGPGTIAMIVGLVAFGAYRAFTQPTPSQPRYFEADAQGRLQPVERPTIPSTSAQLSVPEPAGLLALADLSPEQRTRIEAIVAAWAKEKRDLESRMRKETAFLNEAAGTHRSLASLQGELGHYSELSREYGGRREQAWQEAFAVLTPAQRMEVKR
ncbi:MAG: hypothetical protein M9921_13370 [Fimbriimonadaceae bacterium]|nr:hypothetical protein [Chthonomonadaceae bacterium]MCO5297836.1 hypothetical protein [Fimbriimonadaceae bacterium]